MKSIKAQRMTVCLAVWLLGALLLAAPAVVRGDDPPPVFDKRPYADARQAAMDAKKWFVVKGTAEWCMPCKQMDRTTWRDEKVVAWLKEHAFAVAVDVDKQRAVARDLKIRAMPTIIAFKDGEEFDRIVGYKSPADFLVWLEGLAQGKKSIEALREHTAPKGEGRENIEARLNLARSLAASGDIEEATREYVWLWENMLVHNPAMVGVRGSFMASEMQNLANESDVAREAFRALREKAAEALKREKVEYRELDDWIVLNKVIDDEKATLTWFDQAKEDPRWGGMMSMISFRLEELLLANERWADLGKLHRSPMEQLKRDHQMIAMFARFRPQVDGLTDEMQKELEDMPHRNFRDKAGVLYASLLAAKRHDVAEKLAQEARRLDGSSAMLHALVSTALRARQPRAEHLEWISSQAGADAVLRTLELQVRDGLKRSPK